MLTRNKWKELSLPLYVEEINLTDRAENNGLTDEERKRLAHLKKLLNRFFARFLRHNPSKR